MCRVRLHSIRGAELRCTRCRWPERQQATRARTTTYDKSAIIHLHATVSVCADDRQAELHARAPRRASRRVCRCGSAIHRHRTFPHIYCTQLAVTSFFKRPSFVSQPRTSVLRRMRWRPTPLRALSVSGCGASHPSVPRQLSTHRLHLRAPRRLNLRCDVRVRCARHSLLCTGHPRTLAWTHCQAHSRRSRVRASHIVRASWVAGAHPSWVAGAHPSWVAPAQPPSLPHAPVAVALMAYRAARTLVCSTRARGGCSACTGIHGRTTLSHSGILH